MDVASGAVERVHEATLAPPLFRQRLSGDALDLGPQAVHLGAGAGGWRLLRRLA